MYLVLEKSSLMCGVSENDLILLVRSPTTPTPPVKKLAEKQIRKISPFYTFYCPNIALSIFHSPIQITVLIPHLVAQSSFYEINISQIAINID